MPEQPQATVLWTIDEVGVELLSDLGDLLIEAGSATKQAVAHFKVSQAVLSHASLVWRIMVSRTNLKTIGVKGWTRDYTLRLLTLPEDDAEGLRTLLRIAHLQFNLVPVEVSARHLSSISQICYRYQTQDLVVGYLERWLKGTRDYVRSGDCEPNEDLIWTVWVFDRTKSLRTVTQEVMRHVGIQNFSAWKLPELYQRLVLRNMKARQNIIKSRIYDLLHCETSCRKVFPAGCSRSEREEQEYECLTRRRSIAMHLIGFELGLPLPLYPDHATIEHCSLKEVMSSIEQAEWLVLRKIADSVHADCAAKFTDLLQQVKELCISLDDVDEELSNLVYAED